MAEKARSLEARPVWAYSYELVPPQTQERVLAIKAMLDDETARARKGERTWEGRLVHEEMITHILVVSDSPAQDLDVNHKLEEALRNLKAPYSITSPMSVRDEPPARTRNPSVEH
jgi:hypothetical protein